MSKLLKVTLIIHIVLAIGFGLPLLVAPGRFLGLIDWLPGDPLLSRILGAALLGFGWLDFCTLRGSSAPARRAVIETGIIFNGLAAIGLLRNMLGAYWPWYAWTLLGIFIVLAALWVVNYLKK